MTNWKERLKDEIPLEMAKLIDTYEAQMSLRQQGKMDEKVFAEARLRKGVYGQRYDNGQRHDGVRTQALDYPSAGHQSKVPTHSGTRPACSASRFLMAA